MKLNPRPDGRGEKKQLRGVRDLRTPAKARIRSKPKAAGQEYLDLWVLMRERGRWHRMQTRAMDTIEEIDKDVRKMATGMQAVAGGQDQENPEEGPQSLPAGNGRRDVHPGTTEPRPEQAGKTFGAFRVEY